jgi:ribosomal-protein-alanine N-acetyltransferase
MGPRVSGMASEVVLREYRAGDLEAICLLDEVCFAEAFRFDRASMRLFAERRRAISLVAEVEGGNEIAGFVIVHLEGNGAALRGYVVTLDVAEEWRRRGVAEALMDEAEGQAKAAGAVVMDLHVYTGNEGAIRFYEGRGYVQTGVGKRFYGAAGLDAFVYRKVLEE